jgi:hypothetical protein
MSGHFLDTTLDKRLPLLRIIRTCIEVPVRIISGFRLTRIVCRLTFPTQRCPRKAADSYQDLAMSMETKELPESTR